MSSRRGRSSVSKSAHQNDPLPAPSTSRVLRTRSRTTSIARAARSASSRSQSRASSTSASLSGRISHSNSRQSSVAFGEMLPSMDTSIPSQGVKRSAEDLGLDVGSPSPKRPKLDRKGKGKAVNSADLQEVHESMKAKSKGKGKAKELPSSQGSADTKETIELISASGPLSSQHLEYNPWDPSFAFPESSSQLQESNGLVHPELTSYPYLSQPYPEASGSSSYQQPLSPSAVSSASNHASSSSTASSSTLPTPPTLPEQPPPTSAPELLSAYTCPICFCAPTNATLTPCGHVACGACLFTAIKTTMHRTMVMGADGSLTGARCPVCRAPIPGWDGRGGGVVGLKLRAVFTL